MGRSGLSTQWDCHCWAPQEAVDPTALSSAPGFHMWDSLALNAIPATASPVHSRVGGGFPVALQRNSANCPGCTVSCGGWMETMGAAGAAEADRGGERTQGQGGACPLTHRNGLLAALFAATLAPMAICPQSSQRRLLNRQ